MALPAVSSSYCASFPAPATSTRPRRGRSLRLAAAGGRDTPASLNNWRDAALQVRPAAVDRRRQRRNHSDTLIALQHPPVFSLPPRKVIIRALRSAFSIRASRVDPSSVTFFLSDGDQKVASIGIHVVFPRYITCQGVTLNVTTNLSPFEMTVPCGIKDSRMGSIKEILQKAPDGRGIDETSLMNQAYKEFADVFKLSLDHSPDWSLQAEPWFQLTEQCFIGFFCTRHESVQADNRGKHYFLKV
ncbi:hypothetical protein SETIT_3G374400v2 [Setaria italica]|uniref:BPL/LPL catalytic domain-containing protein n=1 Tax=Setaria italica TaxID=4555 RepID=K3ZC02_SETIT|nr:hypothetical protein SETIT_3G374400v2 [Setaria italica]